MADRRASPPRGRLQGRPRRPSDGALANGRWRQPEVAFWVAVCAAWFVLPSWHVLGSQILIAGLFAVSLDLVLGYAGILSLGHAAWLGVGAYTAGLLAAHGWHEPISAVAVAAIAAGIVGYLVSFLVVRGTDLTRLVVTLGIGLMLWEGANKASSITGGIDGLAGITLAPILGVWSFDLRGDVAYVYTLAVVLAVFVVVRRVVGSPFGLALVGIREGSRRMPLLGVPVEQRLRAAFTLGAAVAGIAGALLVQTAQFVGTDSLSFQRSAEVLVMLVLGGTGRLYGGMIGAFVFMVAQRWLSGIDPVYWEFWIGCLLVVVVLYFRGGILGGIDALRRRVAGADP